MIRLQVTEIYRLCQQSVGPFCAIYDDGEVYKYTPANRVGICPVGVRIGRITKDGKFRGRQGWGG